MLNVPGIQDKMRSSQYHLWRSATDTRVSLEDLRDIVSLELLSPPRLRLLRQDKFEDARTLQGFRDGRPILFAAFEDVREKVNTDSTLIIDDISPLFPTAEALCHELETMLAHPCPANLYCAATPSASFGPHADQHDVLVVQLLGSKLWQFPVQTTLPDSQSIMLEAGDCLFVKEGFVHDVHATRGLSIHLTIAIS